MTDEPTHPPSPNDANAGAAESDDPTRQAAAAAAEPDTERIVLDRDDLTEEARARQAELLEGDVKDLPYRVAGVDQKPGSIRVFHIEVPADAFKAEHERLLAEWAREMTVPGFRKGRAPLKLVQIRLGDEATRDVVRSVALNVFRQVALGEKLPLVADPAVVRFTPPDDGAPLRLEIEAEVEPTVELKRFSGWTVEVEARPVDEARVTEQLERLRRQNAVHEAAPPDAAFEEEDVALLDVEVFNSRGERLAHLCQTDVPFDGYSSRLPRPVAEAVKGKKAGETFEVEVEDTVVNRRGETVVHRDRYRVTVKEIRRSRLPELDDEFAKDLGEYETLDALRAAIRKELEEAEERRRRSEALSRIYRKMIEENPVDVPRTLALRKQVEMIQNDSRQLGRLGLSLDHVVHDAERYLADQRAGAQAVVALHYLLRELIRSQQFEVTDADVDAEIERIAAKEGRKPLSVRAELEARKQLDKLRDALLGRKVEELLLTGNTVVYKPPASPEPAPDAAGAST